MESLMMINQGILFSYAVIGFFAIFIFLFYMLIKGYKEIKWLKKEPCNFEFKYRGKKYWYSRSVSTVAFLFKKDSYGEWCVLANKRGKGTLDYNGYWNCPCGYLEHNMTLEENAVKEIYEECGINLNPKMLKMDSVNSDPSENRQNVTARFVAILPTKEEYKLSSKHSEKNEVDDIRFIKLSEIDDFKWAFGHKYLIKEFAQKYLQ